MSSNRHRNMTGEQLHNPKGFDSASNNTTMMKDGAGSVLWTPQTDLPQALNIVSPQSAPPTENSGDVYIMDTTGTAYDINTITWQSGNTIRIAFNGTPDLSAVAADDYFVTSGNANSSNDGTFQISAVNDGSDYIDIINLNRSDATDDEATDAVGTGYYTLEEWDGVSKNMHVRFDGTSWISVTPSAGYTCYDITSGNILIFDGTDWSTTIATGSVGIANVVEDTTPQLGGTLDANGNDIDMGVNTITDTKVGNWDTAFGWGDHSVAGYLSNIVEDTTPQLGGDLDVQTNEIISTGANNIGLHSNASAYVELGDNLGSNAFDIRDNASGIKLQILSSGDTGIGKSTSLSTAWLSISTSNNNRAHINLEGSSVDKTTPVDGDLWYNTTAGTLNFYDGTTTTDLLAGGGGGLANVVDDTTPQLGGTLDANTFNIGFDDLTGIEDSAGNEMLIFNSNASAVNYLQINNSATGGNVGITALGTDTNINVNIQAKNAGNITLGNFTFDADQTVGAGQDNYVLTYDNATGLISLEASAGGGGGITHFEELAPTAKNITLDNTLTTDAIIIGNNNTMGVKQNDNSVICGFNATVGTTITSGNSFVGGGATSVIQGSYCGIIAGSTLTVTGANWSVAVGGSSNTVSGSRSVALGGSNNTVSSTRSAVIGGQSITANEANAVFMPQIRGIGTGTGSGTSVMKLFDSTASTVNFEVKDNGTINMANLPTSSAGLSAGDLWNNSGVLNIV